MHCHSLYLAELDVNCIFTILKAGGLKHEVALSTRASLTASTSNIVWTPNCRVFKLRER